MAFTKKLLATGLTLGGVLGALAIYNKVTETMAGELDTVLSVEERRYPWKYGDMFYAIKGPREAKPLVLIHGFSPGASSYEWRKNVDALAEQFRVYVVDLLGFGLSDHPAVEYTAETYTDLINDFIKEVVGKPAVVVAHGLTCAYIIACAYRRPQLFERLVLVAPPLEILQENEASSLNTIVNFVLRLPIIGPFLYNLLSSRSVIRGYYDRQGYHNLALITDDLVEYIYTSAHQPNSHYAVASFLANNLLLDVQEPLARLQMPVITIWGRESSSTPSEISAAFKLTNTRIETRILDKSSFHLQEEQASRFNQLVRDFAAAPVS